MFQTYADFSKVDPRSPQHPGQPVHCANGFDVWQNAQGQFYVIQNGTKIYYPTLAAAQAAATSVVAASSGAQAAEKAAEQKAAAAEAELAAAKAKLASDETPTPAASTAPTAPVP